MTHLFRPAPRRAMALARPSGAAARPVDVSAVITGALAAAGLMDAPATARADGAHRLTAALPAAMPAAMPAATPAALRLPGGLGVSGLRSGLPRMRGGRGEPPSLPEGARWEARRFEGPEGARDYRLFLPSPRGAAPAGVLVMLHGCTQDPEDFARGTRMNEVAERHGLAVVWPQQGPAHNPQSCWNWFRPEDQRREGGEPALLAAITRAVLGELGVPEGRAAVAGLSAGGAMAAILAVTHSDLFAAAGVHSGLPAGSARDVASAFAVMRAGGGRQGRGAPLIVFHGTADATVSPANADALVPGAAMPGGATSHGGNGRRWSRAVAADGSELWRVEGGGHAWFGGDASGSFADPLGPDASEEIARFALARMEGKTG